MAALVNVDGTPYIARIIVDEDRHGNRLYNHELSDLKQLQEIKSPQPLQSGGAQGQQIGWQEFEDTGKLLQWIFSVNENDVKTTTQENSNPESTETTSTTNESSPSSSPDSEDPNIMYERKSKIDERTYSSLQEKFRALAEKIYQMVTRRASNRRDGSPRRKGVLRAKQLFAERLTLTPEERKITKSPLEIVLVHDASGRLESTDLGFRTHSYLPSNLPEGSIVTHNHPGGRGPSSSDIKHVLQNPSTTFRIVTINEKNQTEIFQLKAVASLEPEKIKQLVTEYKDDCNSYGDTASARREFLALLAEKQADLMEIKRTLPSQ